MPSLGQTLTKLHDAVSDLTRFLEFKPDHMLGCILDRQACTPAFATFQAILTPVKPNPVETARWSFLEFKFDRKFGCQFDRKFGCQFDQQACMQILRHSKIFSPPLSPTLAKPHNEVSRLTNFSKLKFNHRFKSAFGK